MFCRTGRVLALALVPLLIGVPSAQDQPTLTVSAAISLAEAIEDVADAFTRTGGPPVRLNLAGSNALARQIVMGAPVDVFVSADEAQMDVAAAAGAIVAESRVPIVSNQLALVAAPERVEDVRSGFPAGAAAIRRLALGDPAAVPAGAYAREYLQRVGLWHMYEGRVVPLPHVRAALAAVENGSADAAIVYATDVRLAARAALVMLIPIDKAPGITYPAAIVSGSRHRSAAARFVRFLQSSEARGIFEQHGFLAPPKP